MESSISSPWLTVIPDSSPVQPMIETLPPAPTEIDILKPIPEILAVPATVICAAPSTDEPSAPPVTVKEADAETVTWLSPPACNV